MTVVAPETPVDAVRSLGLTPELRRLRLPQVQVVGAAAGKRPTRKAILGDLFYVYGREARLGPPIDWLQDPHGSRTWRYELHTLTWLREALARHAAAGDVETLAKARDVVVDWARAHLRGDEKQSEFAWYDMAVGLRAPYVGYVLRASLAEGMLGDEEAELLLEAAERHGAELADHGGYAAGNNHGLFQDEGLYLLARQLPVLPAATAWRELALFRIKTGMAATIDFAEGAHLEHSSAYQLAMVELVSRLADHAADLPDAADLLARLRRTAAWQTTPAGRMAQLGDTDDLPAPPWARDTAASLRGMNVLSGAGQAFVREGGSYLAVSAAFHGPAHKQSDDTGFLLVEGGRTVLGDTGRWGYYETEADRRYARSAAAHNVLTVDGEDFHWRRVEPYGSGLEAAEERAGWYVIRARNPLLAAQGVEHRRAFLYRPGAMLIVLDDVRAEEEHEYARHFHLGPELEAAPSGPGRVSIDGERTAATLAVTADEEVELVRGREDPRRGWAYPGDRERAPVWTVTVRARAKDAIFATALALGGRTA